MTVTGSEPQLTGDWPCPKCGAKLPEVCPTCDGDGYVDIPDDETGGVLGPKPCPDCEEGSPEQCPGGCREPEYDAERDL